MTFDNDTAMTVSSPSKRAPPKRFQQKAKEDNEEDKDDAMGGDFKPPARPVKPPPNIGKKP